MSTFISKLQYKHYEKGEFTDEQPRDLQQTLNLVRHYPWDEQRGEDVQPTSPSVTIQNDYAEYLKLAIYFNGKFALYLYATDQHMYELHEPTLDEACTIVEQFFNDTIDKGIFDKHYFSTGTKAHFETGNFSCTINETATMFRLLGLGTVSVLYSIIGIPFFLIKGPAALPLLGVFFSLLGCMMVYSTYLLYKVFRRSKEMYLEISAGKPTFQFGETVEEIDTYNKGDIVSVTFFGNVGGKGSQKLTLIRITFKDGHIITFPGLLINPLDMLMKINGIPYTIIRKTGTQISEIRSFTK